jgi:hypothetical protein
VAWATVPSTSNRTMANKFEDLRQLTFMPPNIGVG